jgi:hypothetical protein
MISIVSSVLLIDKPLWPAIIFAVRRTASVPGRIRLLIVSIITMNVISMVGVPWGTRCSNMWLVFLINPNNINLIHKGMARVSVSVKCLVLVKMYGNNPRKLFVRIIRNNDVRMNEFPLFSFPFLRIVFFPGVDYLLVILLLYCFVRGLIRFLLGLVVARWLFLFSLISVVGSKIENKFLIIFSLFYWY